MSPVFNGNPLANGVQPYAASEPTCQWCKRTPAPIVPAIAQSSGGTIAVFHCAGCGAVFGVQLLTAPRPNNLVVRP